MELGCIPFSGGARTMVNVAESVFNVDFNEALVHQVAVAYQANARSGTKGQKNRAAVRGGGAKPWRQKGTGQARAGTSRSPLWRSGGVTFAAKTQNHTQKINKKMYRAAMRSLLSELIRQGRLQLVDNCELDSYKTKDLLHSLKKLELTSEQTILIVVDELTENLYLSSRNLTSVDVCDTTELNPIDLLRYEKVLMSQKAIKEIEAKLQ